MRKYSLFHSISITSNGAKIWYYADLSGYIMEIDTMSGQMKCLFSISYNSNSEPACRNLFYHDEKLYVIPYATGILYIYDLNMSKLVEKVDMGVNAPYFTGCNYRDGYLYFYGNLPLICIYSVSDGSKIIKELVPHELGMPFRPTNWFWTESVLDKEDLYLVMNGSNGLIRISIDNNINYCRIGTDQQSWKIRDLDIVENEIIALYTNSAYKLVSEKYNLIEKKATRREISIPYKWDVYPYSCAENVNDQWIVFPYKTNTIISIDQKSASMRELYRIRETKDLQGRYYFGSSIKADNDNIFAINQIDGTLVKISADTLKVKETPLYFSSESLDEFHTIIINESIKNNGMIHEIDDLITLDVLIKGINE